MPSTKRLKKLNRFPGDLAYRRPPIPSKYVPVLRQLAVQALGDERARQLTDNELRNKVYVATHIMTDSDETFRIWLKMTFGTFPFRRKDMIGLLVSDSGASLPSELFKLQETGNALIVGVGGERAHDDEHPKGGTSAADLPLGLSGSREVNIEHVKGVIGTWGIAKEDRHSCVERLGELVGAIDVWDSSPTAKQFTIAAIWKKYGYSVICRKNPEEQKDGWKITFSDYGHVQLDYLLWWTALIGRRITALEYKPMGKKTLEHFGREIGVWAIDSREKTWHRKKGVVVENDRFRWQKPESSARKTLKELLATFSKKGQKKHWRTRRFLNMFQSYIDRLSSTKPWTPPTKEAYKAVDRPQYDDDRRECPYGFAAITLMLRRCETDESLPKALRLKDGTYKKFLDFVLRTQVHSMWLDEVGGVEAKAEAKVLSLRELEDVGARVAVLHHASPMAARHLRNKKDTRADLMYTVCDGGFRGFQVSLQQWGDDSGEVGDFMRWMQAYVELLELIWRGLDIPFPNSHKKRIAVLTKGSKIDPSINPTQCWFSHIIGQDRTRSGLYNGSYKHPDIPDTAIPEETLVLLMQVLLHAAYTKDPVPFFNHMHNTLSKTSKEDVDAQLRKFLDKFEDLRARLVEEAREAEATEKAAIKAATALVTATAGEMMQ